METKTDSTPILYTDVHIYGYPDADAILCSNGLIQKVGSGRTMKGRTRKISLKGRYLYPGFNDTHLHLLGLGEYLSFVPLNGLESIDEVVTVITQRLQADRNFNREKWLRGMGWDQNSWEHQRFPDKSILDEISTTVPICLSRVDGHAFWVNSVVLDTAGITSETADPRGGRIVRMENSGEPSGILIDRAMDLVLGIMPQVEKVQQKGFVSDAFRYLNSFGITSAGDAGTSLDTFEIIKTMLDREGLPLRINAMIPWREDFQKYRVPGNGFLTTNTFKIFLDGALGSCGAALMEPYTDDPENSGLILEDILEITGFIERVNTDGFQVAVHAIGDRANQLALNAFQDAVFRDKKPVRNRIEHAQIIQYSDLPQFSKLNVFPAIQPVHCTSDMSWIENRLGPDRTADAYPWSSLVKNGSMLLGGSDAPIESPDPLLGMFAASTRQNRDFTPDCGWHPEQRISVTDALRAYTSWAAMGTYEENRKGSLMEGYYADFALLSEPIDTDNPRSLLATKVLKTIVNGKIVYENT